LLRVLRLHLLGRSIRLLSMHIGIKHRMSVGLVSNRG
jgi:hypothetical protein